MQYFLLSIIALPFLWINYLIVKTDIKEKKIPNKLLGYLLLLLPFWWWFLFIIPSPLISLPMVEVNINIFIFIFQIFLTFLVSFILYYFWVWSAWDAKYLLVLALFIPYIWIIPFIWNIALLTIWYLILYFIWFYLGKCLFNWRYTKSLYENIYIDLKEKWLVKKKNTNTHNISIILKLIVIFLIIFISIRLARIYIFAWIFWWDSWERVNRVEFLKDILEKYHIYIFVLFIRLFIGFLWWIKWLITKIKTYIINKFKKKLFNKYKISSEIIDNIFLAVLFVVLLSFIIFEYIKNPYEIETYLIRIFTVYLVIWWIFKILLYSYKIAFSIAETYYVDIKDLKEGDIVDKKDFNKKVLPNLNFSKKYLDFYKLNTNWNIILDKDNIKVIKSLIRTINKKDNKFFKWGSIIKWFSILKTFALWIYIFLWFIITLIYNGWLINIITYIMKILIKIIY